MGTAGNGHDAPPQLAGVAAADAAPGPIVGARACRISRPLLAPPDYRDRYGRAWRCNLAAARLLVPPGVGHDACVAHWVLEAPWSSEVVHSYSLVLIHLRPILGRARVTHYVEGSTHELALWAIHPMTDRTIMLRTPINPRCWLQPAVFAAQFTAASDDTADRAVFRAVELVCSGRLSPHPAHVRAWAQLFGDNMLRVARAPALPAEDEGVKS